MSNESQVTQAPVNFGANLGYILDLYDLYLNDPASVPEDLQVLFSTIKTVKQTSQQIQLMVNKMRLKLIARLNVLCVS